MFLEGRDGEQVDVDVDVGSDASWAAGEVRPDLQQGNKLTVLEHRGIGASGHWLIMEGILLRRGGYFPTWTCCGA